jgi:hypothetical protein
MRPVKEDVSQALTDAAKNWVAMDGLWFQAIEQAYGMDAARQGGLGAFCRY